MHNILIFSLCSLQFHFRKGKLVLPKETPPTCDSAQSTIGYLQENRKTQNISARSRETLIKVGSGSGDTRRMNDSVNEWAQPFWRPGKSIDMKLDGARGPVLISLTLAWVSVVRVLRIAEENGLSWEGFENSGRERSQLGGFREQRKRTVSVERVLRTAEENGSHRLFCTL